MRSKFWQVGHRVPGHGGGIFDVVYFDFESAFETMNHNLLVSTPHTMGAGESVLLWLSDFVRNRSFKVGRTFSRDERVLTGASQGTVLGSLLFMFFIDGIKQIIPNEIRYVTYADDVKLMNIGSEDDTSVRG